MPIETASIYGTVPSTSYLGLLGAEGPNLPKMMDLLAFGEGDVADAAGASRADLRHTDRIPPEVLERLVEIATVCELVAEYFEGDPTKTALWFKISNPLLGHVSPRDMIRVGRYRKVLRLVQDARRAESKAVASVP